ncbi:unnamed protein product [Closterium sp. NIES-53]
MSGGYSGGGGGGGNGGGGGPARGAAAQRGGFGGSQRHQQPRSRETPSAQQLREWYAGRGRSGSAGPCTYVLRTGTRRGEACGLPHYAALLRAEGGCYLSVPPDPGIAAPALGTSASAALGTGESTALGAGESALFGTAPTEAFHTFTLDSGVSRSFFRDSTTLTPLSRPVTVSLGDPSWGPVLAYSSTVLPCPAAPLGLLSGLHLPSFSTNLVSGADLHPWVGDAWVDQFTLGGQRVTHCTCSRTGRHLATFTPRPGSSLYTLTTAPPPVSASSQVAVSSQVFAAASRSSPASAPYSCRPLSHENLLWHHRLGHPSLPRLRGMASRALVSGLPRSLPPLPPGRDPTCVPCVEGRQRAAPHSSMFPSTEAPLQTLHMDVWGPARVRGQGHERYFLLVVDDYSRYTTVFPLRSKGEVPEVLIDWICGARRQLSETFGSDLPVLRLHSDRGGEFSSDLLRAFCRAEGIRQTFTLPASLEQNGIDEHRIGMVMDVACTSMIHAAAPHFLWPFAVQYATHQINLQPCVSLPETTPTLRWTGKVGNAFAFRVWGSRAFVRDTSADKLSSRAVPRVDPAEPFQVAVDSSAARGAEPAGAGIGGAEPERVEPGGAESGGAESGRVEPGGAELGRVRPEVTASVGAEPARAEFGGALGVPSRREPLSRQQLREWYSWHCRGAAGAGAAGVAGGAAGGAGGAAGAGDAGGATGAGGAAGAGAAGGAAGAGAARAARAAGGTAGAVGGAAGIGGVAGAGAARGAAGAGAAGAAGGAGDPGAAGTGSFSTVSEGAARPRPYYDPLLQQVLGSPPSPDPPPPFLSPPPRPSTAPQRVPLPSLPASSLPVGPEPASDSLRAASPAVTRFPATAVTDPLFDSTAASALVTELVEFAAACRLDYATSLVAESASASVCPPSVVGECALSTDVLEDRHEEVECFAATVPHLVSMLLLFTPDIPTPRSYAQAIEGPYSSQWQAAMDAEMASWKSTGTYVDEVPPPGANIASGMWIFRGVDFFQTFSPTPKMTTLWVLLHVAAQCDYELHSLDFNTAFLRGSLHEEIWLRRPPGFTGSFPAGTQWSLQRPVYGLRQAPREWHDTLRTTLAALGFAPSTSDPSLFLRTDTTPPPFYVLVYVDVLG